MINKGLFLKVALCLGRNHQSIPQQLRLSHPIKVRTLGYGNLQTMNTDKWATSKSTQLS